MAKIDDESSPLIMPFVAQNAPRKDRQLSNASPAPWFLRQTIKPFQAQATHRAGCTRETTRQNVKAPSYTHHNRDPESFEIFGDPFFLSGHAHSDEQERRFGTNY